MSSERAHTRQTDPGQRGTGLLHPADAPDASVEQLQATIQQLQNQLVIYHQLALAGTVAMMVAHELNNILTPVMARAQDAISRNDSAAMRKTVERTLTMTEKATAIVKRQLHSARRDEQPPEPYNVGAAVAEALETMARAPAKDNIDLRLSIPKELSVLARPIELEQVLLNLLYNARNALKDARGGWLHVSAKRDGDQVVIDVHDSGRGIAPERIRKVINPFLAADPKADPKDWRAVGIGLNVCRLIAHRHGATVEVVAENDDGCTFRLRWPAA
ncbi:MAG: HAMP domain-containing histidine kinase [Planctomycetes bacterium]|nr:HAMP domain-containing histidine kinase [Planctomycetota bacterium]